MRTAPVWTAILMLAAAGCNRAEPSSSQEGGRYAGIGTYPSDAVWRHMQGAPQGNAAQAALSDDSQIIVVVDRRTGEVRQCGNHSGFCVAMNPWQGLAPRLPAKVGAHADQLDAEAPPNAAQ